MTKNDLVLAWSAGEDNSTAPDGSEDAAVFTDNTSFASWKLDMIDALTCDPRLMNIERLVAIRILQHINRRDRTAHPSYSRIAAQLGVSEKTVSRAANNLAHKHNWMTRYRPTRTSTWTYSFNDQNSSGVLDAKVVREDEASDALRLKKQMLFEQRRADNNVCSRGDNTAPVERTNHAQNEGTAVSSKHLPDNSLQQPLPGLGNEKRASRQGHVGERYD